MRSSSSAILFSPQPRSIGQRKKLRLGGKADGHDTAFKQVRIDFPPGVMRLQEQREDHGVKEEGLVQIATQVLSLPTPAHHSRAELVNVFVFRPAASHFTQVPRWPDPLPRREFRYRLSPAPTLHSRDPAFETG